MNLCVSIQGNLPGVKGLFEVAAVCLAACSLKIPRTVRAARYSAAIVLTIREGCSQVSKNDLCIQLQDFLLRTRTAPQCCGRAKFTGTCACKNCLRPTAMLILPCRSPYFSSTPKFLIEGSGQCLFASRGPFTSKQTVPESVPRKLHLAPPFRSQFL